MTPNIIIRVIPIDKNQQIFWAQEHIKDTFSKLSPSAFLNPAKLGFSCMHQGKITTIFSTEASYSYYIEQEVNDALLIYIDNFVNRQKLTPRDKYNLFLLSQKLKFTEQELNRLFFAIGWKNGKHGSEYFFILQEFSPLLKTLYFDNKLGLKEAILFHKSFTPSYDEFISLLPAHLTLSESNTVFLFVTEIAGKNKLSLSQIQGKLDFTNKTKLLESLYNLRYPYYSKTLRKINDYIKSLSLPSASKIIFDKTFEDDKYTLQVVFKDIITLSKKLHKINDICESQIASDAQDLFIRDNLFKEEQNE